MVKDIKDNSGLLEFLTCRKAKRTGTLKSGETSEWILSMYIKCTMYIDYNVY